jgi:hypothetical protein
MTNSENSPATSNRVFRSYAQRVGTAAEDAFVPAPPQPDNGDEARYSDKCGTYTKCVKQAGIGRVDLNAYQTFRKALDSGDPADFAAIQVGGARTLNGPQGGLAFDLEGLDSSQFASPPAPALASEAYGTELVELYWGALLRDVAFADYDTNPVAAQAANEISGMGTYAGPRDAANKVTPKVLFRGRFPGETIGPYISQFLLQKTDFGGLAIDQKYMTLQAGTDYVTDPNEFQKVQNGASTGKSVMPTAPAYLYNGRGLCAYTHVDVLYQAYFIAYLVLNSMKAPFNPGNPYIGSTTQNGFNTMGQPDIAATLTAVAAEALKAVWYQKWYIHLRHRPESGGAIVHLIKTGQGGTIKGQLNNNVLTSQAVQSSFTKYGTYFLSQSFPEGSPAHPAYPTGHGTVAGACITVLKYFFDGEFVIPNPQVASNDGSKLNKYTEADAGKMTVNSELHKLACNVSFGHGIHAGIHWRSDTDTSVELGEAVALSVLRDRARTYNEKCTVSLKKLDGTIATISNQ